MTFEEGSVFNEESDEMPDESEGSEEESTDESESTDQTDSEEESKDESSDSTLKDQENNKTEETRTEKGTKLDPDPLSAANQQLANERAKIKQYEEVLNNPTLLKGYVAQFDKDAEAPKKEESKSDEPEMRVEDIQTTEDLQKYQRQQDKKVEAKLKELDETITTVKTTQQDTQVASRIQSDITTIRSQWDELDPKRGKDGKPTNPNYNQALDISIGALYDRVDGIVDPRTGQITGYKGQISIKEIADNVMRGAEASKLRGSTEAQTAIRDKRSGRAVSGASSTAPDESQMTSTQLIAHRIKMARASRGR